MNIWRKQGTLTYENIQNKKSALETIIRNKSIIGYTAEYIIIISVTEIIYRYIAFWALNNISGIPDAAKIIFKAVFDLLNAQFLTAYIYMLIRGKMKFKRFFSFFHKKHLSYYLLTSAVIISYRIIDRASTRFRSCL